MKTKTKLLGAGIAVLGVAGIMGIGTSALAYQGNPNIQGPNYTPERHLAVEKAFDTNNYASWKELMQGRGRVTEVINASNFSRFSEAHRLAEQGKIAEANAIRAELGLGNGIGKGLRDGSGAKMGRGTGQGRGFEAQHVSR